MYTSQRGLEFLDGISDELRAEVLRGRCPALTEKSNFEALNWASHWPDVLPAERRGLPTP